MLMAYFLIIVFVTCFLFSFIQGTRSSLVPLLLVSGGILAIPLFGLTKSSDSVLMVISFILVFFVGAVLHFHEREG